jgi:hypothetical protein
MINVVSGNQISCQVFVDVDDFDRAAAEALSPMARA